MPLPTLACDRSGVIGESSSPAAGRTPEPRSVRSHARGSSTPATTDVASGGVPAAGEGLRLKAVSALEVVVVDKRPTAARLDVEAGGAVAGSGRHPSMVAL